MAMTMTQNISCTCRIRKCKSRTLIEANLDLVLGMILSPVAVKEFKSLG